MTRVAGQGPDGRGKTRRRRNGAAIAVSLLAHIVVFAIVGFNAPKLIAPALAPLPVDVWIMPRLTPQAHKPAEHKTAQTATASTTKAPPTKPLQPKTTRAAGQPAPAAPLTGPPGAAAKGAPAPIDGSPDGVQEALRTSVGCDFDKNVHLTRAERDRCNQSYGETARAAPAFSGIDPLKRGRFDDQAAADERRRANRNGPLNDLVIPCTGQGSNLGGGCLPDSAIAHIRPH